MTTSRADRLRHVPIGPNPEARMRFVRSICVSLLALLLTPLSISADPRYPSLYELLDTENTGDSYPSEGRGYYAPATALGDLNGDGRADIVTGEGGIRVWLSHGDGTFEPRGLAIIVREYAQIALGDLDGDGRLDLVGTQGPLYVHRGLGDGTFAAPTSYANGGDKFIRLADLDRDGRIDVLTSDGMSCRMRSGAAGGELDSVLTQSFIAGTDLLCANVEGDSRLEILGSDGSQLSVTTWDPLADSHPNRTVGPSGAFLATGDFNRDGWWDVATGGRIYLGGAAGLSAAGTVSLDARSTGDVNGDGILDLLGTRGRFLAIARGRGDGSFDAPTELPSPESTDWIECGDFDGDGKADALVRRPYSKQSAVYLGLADADARRIPTFPTSGPSSQIVASDFTGDGHADALVLAADGSLSLLAGNGNGGLGSAQAIAMPGSIAMAIAMDFNHDGRNDLAAVARTTSNLYVRLKSASGNGFETAETYELSILASWLGGADLDGDGALDMIVADIGGHRQVLHNEGDGQFGTPPASTNNSLGSPTRRYAIGDTDGDGRLDFVGLRQGSFYTDFCVWGGDDEGGFNEWFSGPNAHGVMNAFASFRELNHQKGTELVCAADEGVRYVSSTQYRSYVTILTEGFASWATDFTAAEGLTALHVADLDGDGRVEYVTAGSRVNALTVWTSDAEGTPVSRRAAAVDVGPSSIASADFNEDGRIDLVVVHSGAPMAVVLIDAATDPAPRLAHSPSPVVGESGVTLAWRAGGLAHAWARVLRRDDHGAELVSAPTRLDEDGQWTYTDGDVVLGRKYDYRLLVDSPDGPVVAGRAVAKIKAFDVSPQPIPVPADRRLTIASPSRGTTIAFGLAGFAATPVEVTLHSVAGRVIGRWTVSGGGNVQLARPVGLPPGVYLIRTVQGTHAVTGRVVLL